MDSRELGVIGGLGSARIFRDKEIEKSSSRPGLCGLQSLFVNPIVESASN